MPKKSAICNCNADGNIGRSGPRYMKIKYMNAMAVVERLGPPDYFLTFTANGQWPEIKASTHNSCRMGEPQVDYEAILTVLFCFQDYSVLKMNTEKDYNAVSSLMRED
ncbi:unnamed protein product [Phyllotreta striolata]|uniref:Helitron helicase-like domain-containing protein n=1 Tax=Phyllotreta striolata TaxID=444603 RepID=A0A9P0E013_PHYSR|nr:unnamed protein product [Phyllotreta striolata]